MSSHALQRPMARGLNILDSRPHSIISRSQGEQVRDKFWNSPNPFSIFQSSMKGIGARDMKESSTSLQLLYEQPRSPFLCAPEPHRTTPLIKKCKSIQIKRQCRTVSVKTQSLAGDWGSRYRVGLTAISERHLKAKCGLDNFCILDWSWTEWKARRDGKIWEEKALVQSSSWHPRNVMPVATPCRPYFSLKLRPCWNSPNVSQCWRLICDYRILQDIVPWQVSLSRIHVPEIKNEIMILRTSSRSERQWPSANPAKRSFWADKQLRPRGGPFAIEWNWESPPSVVNISHKFKIIQYQMHRDVKHW